MTKKNTTFLTIRNKLYLISLLGVMLLIVISIVSWEQSRAMQKMDQQRVAIMNFSNNLLALRESEQDFLTFQNASTKKSFQIRYEKLIEGVRLLMGEFENEEGDTQDMKDFLAHIENYKMLFDQLVPLQMSVGMDQTEGIRGKMRDALYKIEAVLGKVNNRQFVRLLLHREMLMIQRPEKDLVLRKQAKYINKFDFYYEIMKKDVKATLPENELQKELLLAMSGYYSIFHELADTSVRIGLTPSEGLRGEMRQTFENSLDIAAIMHLRINSEIENEGAGQVNQSIAWVIALASLISCMIWWTSRSINIPLRRIRNSMAQLAAGDLEVEIGAVSRGDEIGSMARSIEVFRENALERRKAEDALKNSYDALEKRVLERTVDLEEQIQERKVAEEAMREAKEEAERANQAKSQFLSSMSHELRTPLNAILGFGQLMQNSRKEPLKTKQARFIEQILSGGRHLLKLINEILDLAKIESGTMSLSIEEIQHELVIQEAIDLVSPLAEERGSVIEKRVLLGGTLLGDYIRLKQVLVNFLSNAVKYGREQGHIIVEVKESPLPDIIRLSVIDDGAGIPQEKQSELFKPFSRLGAEQGEIEGSGIGLAITKKIVEMMNGNIGFFSEEGQGCTFWLELPVGKSEKMEIQMASESEILETITHTIKQDSTLLYIEDNPANLQLMENIMEEFDGIRLLSAHTPHLGLALARAEHPSLIVSDINLPGMDGFEVLQHLKQEESTRDIPVIALSANAMPNDIRRGEEAGFLHYLTKPLDIAQFCDVVEAILKEQE